MSGNLTEHMPESSSETTDAIYAYWKKRGDSEPERGYLGGSAIGDDCSRKLWYSFRKCSRPDFEGRLYRLFNRGHREEETFVEELRGIGCEVHEFGPDGNQIEVVDFGGHFKGHADGVARGIPEAPKTWHLLEMKTSNTKDFKGVKDKGVQDCKPVHYAQMQVYMQLLSLDRALYMVVCKETDELYTERVTRDPRFAKSLLKKAEYIIFSESPPPKLSADPEFFKCIWCEAKGICHGVDTDVVMPVPKLNCRQCAHATAERDGTWSCAAGKVFGIVCKHHLFNPNLIEFAEPVDVIDNPDGSRALEFRNFDDGAIWHHGSNAEAGQYSSGHLATMPKSAILPRLTSGSLDLWDKWSLGNNWIKEKFCGLEGEVGEFLELNNLKAEKPRFTHKKDGQEIYDFDRFCVAIHTNSNGVRSASLRIDENQI